MRKLFLALVILLVAGALIFSGCQSASSAVNAADFYKGKSIDWYIMTAAGGGHDTVSRLYSDEFSKTTGVKVTSINKEGGGLMLAPIYVSQSAKPDGLTISSCDVFISEMAQIMKTEGMENVDISKWNWLGSMRSAPTLFFVNAKLPYKTLGDVFKAKDFKDNVNSTASSAAIFGKMILEGSAKMQGVKVIHGIEGSGAMAAAVVRGEFDGTSMPTRQVLPFIKDGSVRPIVILSKERDPDLPDCPSLPEALKDAGLTLDSDGMFWLDVVGNDPLMRTAVIAPPNVPKDRVQWLRDNLAKAAASKDLIDKGTKADLQMKFLPGDQVQKWVTDMVNMSPERAKELKQKLQF